MASSDSLRNVTTMVIKKPSQSPFAFKDQPAETDIGDARDFAQICLNKPIPKFGWRGIHQLPSNNIQSTSSEDAGCSIFHPGSLTCLHANTEVDEATSSCTVSMSVEVTKLEGGASMAELEELGWLAIKKASGEKANHLGKRLATQSIPGNEDERHRVIVNILAHGFVVNVEKKNVNSFEHENYEILLEDPKSKRRIKALFKPRIEGDGEGWHRVPIEEAAYHLNLLLGMDLVPPAVFRQVADVDYHHYEHGGTMIYWADRGVPLGEIPCYKWGIDKDLLLSDTRILDVLIQNSDRHALHFMSAEHWAKGEYTGQNQHHQGGKQRAGHARNGGNGASAEQGSWVGRRAPCLIDQAAGFRPDAFVTLDHENAFQTGPCRKISAKTYMRLRFLSSDAVQEAMGHLISREEVMQLIERKDNILSFFDGLVERYGYREVVIEE